MIHHAHPDCPLTQERMTLGRWVESPDPDKGRVLAIFEKDVSWLAETETTYRLLVNGHEVKKYSICGDYYGFATSVRECVSDAEGAAVKLGIVGREDVKIVCEAKLYRTPVRLINLPSRGISYEVLPPALVGDEETLRRVESFDWNQDLPEGAWRPSCVPSLARQDLLTRIVWSSAAPVGKQDAMEEFLALALTELEGVGL